MRKVALSGFMSLDGYVNASGGEFIGPAWSGDLDAWTFDLMDRSDTLLFGRRCFEDLAQYWPRAEREPQSDAEAKLAVFMNRTRKIVFSRAGCRVDTWSNSELAQGSPGEVLETLRRLPGREITLLGGAHLARTFIAQDLLDDYRVLILPTLFGGGTRLFECEHSLRGMKRVGLTPMDTGATLLHLAREHQG